MIKNPFRARVSRNERSSLRFSTSFLPPGTNAVYELTLPLGGITPFAVFDGVERSSIDRLLRLPILTNLKGSGPHDTILTVRGELKLEDETVPFTFSTTTPFHDFVGKDQIRFSWKDHTEPSPLEGLKRSEIGHREDLLIREFDFTVEGYRSTILTRMMGFGPVAADALALSVTPAVLQLCLSADGLPDDRLLPFSSIELLQTLDTTISDLFNFSFLSDYRNHQGKLS